MGKAIKTGRLREKTLAEVKQSKQTTFDSLPTVQEKLTQKAEAHSNKQIIITEIGNETKEDDLDLKVVFRLIPSRAAFSKITAELYFDGQKMHCCAVRIPQGPLSADAYELPVPLDMMGIGAGPHFIRVEMFELWNSEEKLTPASKEVTIDYVPVRRQDRFIKIPIVKNAAAEIDVVSEPERDVYREIEKDSKKELVGRRDDW
jgi:hypothetical protein